MKDFKKGGFGDRGNRGGGDRFPRREFDSRPAFGNKFNKGGGDRRPDMHQATCANCGKTCEVPFRPNGEKPVYCSDCFGAMKGGNDRPDTRSSFPKKEFGDRGDRQSSYAKPEVREVKDPRIDELKSELAKANSKLDRLMDLVRLNGRAAAPEVSKKEATKVEAPQVKSVAKKIEKKAEKKPVAKVAAKKKAVSKKK